MNNPLSEAIVRAATKGCEISFDTPESNPNINTDLMFVHITHIRTKKSTHFRIHMKVALERDTVLSDMIHEYLNELFPNVFIR